jgi:uracil-DNA glycosylase
MTGGGAEYLPAGRSLSALRREVQSCRGCDLWREATQAVFGSGAGTA